MPDSAVIWTPTEQRCKSSLMHGFMVQLGYSDYDGLYRWSVENPAAFWEAICDFCDVQFASEPHTTLARPENIMDAGWFEGGTLNYAAHQLRHRGDRAAIIFCGEDGSRRELSFDALRAEVAAVAAGLRAAGVVKG
ncbi:MAG: acetyl-coenzyme A synthetase N-terminal domain-containing protein, partial [Woeseiaceae bacterium]